jgi:hypothetical protein
MELFCISLKVHLEGLEKYKEYFTYLFAFLFSNNKF